MSNQTRVIRRYYSKHTTAETMRKFNLQKHVLQDMIQKYNFEKWQPKKYGVGTVLDNPPIDYRVLDFTGKFWRA